MAGRTIVFEGALAQQIEAEAKAWRKAPEKLLQEGLLLLAQERARRRLDKIAKEPTRPWSEVRAEVLAAQ